MELKVGQEARLYHPDEFYDDGEITVVTDRYVEVDFANFKVRYTPDSFEVMYSHFMPFDSMDFPEIALITKSGIMIEDYNQKLKT